MDENDRADLGGTVQRVAELELQPDPEFGPKLTRRIHRRLLGGDLADFSILAFAHAVMEYLLALFGATNPETDSEDDEQ